VYLLAEAIFLLYHCYLEVLILMVAKELLHLRALQLSEQQEREKVIAYITQVFPLNVKNDIFAW
jgi:hypothetical protein